MPRATPNARTLAAVAALAAAAAPPAHAELIDNSTFTASARALSAAGDALLSGNATAFTFAPGNQAVFNTGPSQLGGGMFTFTVTETQTGENTYRYTFEWIVRTDFIPANALVNGSLVDALLFEVGADLDPLLGRAVAGDDDAVDLNRDIVTLLHDFDEGSGFYTADFALFDSTNTDVLGGQGLWFLTQRGDNGFDARTFAAAGGPLDGLGLIRAVGTIEVEVEPIPAPHGAAAIVLAAVFTNARRRARR